MWGKRRSLADVADTARLNLQSVEEAKSGTDPSTAVGDASTQPECVIPAPDISTSRPQDCQSSAAQIALANGAHEPPSTAAPAKPTAHGTSNQEVAFALTFTRIVSVLMRSIHYKHHTLRDLEWLVVPAILSGQCAVMQARMSGGEVPVAAALWARVSEDVDRRLSQDLNAPVKLRPDEWRSGNIVWLIDAVGDPKAIAHLLKHIQESALKGAEIKARTLGPESNPIVKNLKLVSPT